MKIAYSKEALQRIDEIIMDAITDPNVAPDTSEIAKKIVAAGITRLDGSPVPNGTISSRAFYLRTGHGGNFKPRPRKAVASWAEKAKAILDSNLPDSVKQDLITGKFFS